MAPGALTEASNGHACCAHLPPQSNDRDPPATIEIDPDGDLRLLIGEDKVPFIVCARALARSARIWKTMLFGPFTESKRSAEVQGPWTVELPEDDPAAFEVVLHLVHAQPHKIPKMTVNLAFEVTVVTNKYKMTSCLWPVAKDWLEELPKSWACTCKEPSRPEQYPCYTGKGPSSASCRMPPLEWLWITQELGEWNGYQATLRDFALETEVVHTVSPGGLDIFNEWREDMHNAKEIIHCLVEEQSCFSRSANIIRSEFVRDTLDQLKAARLEALEMLRVPFAEDMRKLEDLVESHRQVTNDGRQRVSKVSQFSCQANGASGVSRIMCDVAMSFASTAWKEGEYGWCYPLTPSADQVIAPWELQYHLEDGAGWFESSVIRDGLDAVHENCSPWKSPLPSRKELWESVGKVPDKKVAYILEQAKLSGVRREEVSQSGVKRKHDQMEEQQTEEV